MRRVFPLLLVVALACSHVSRREAEDPDKFDSPDAAAAFDAMKRGIDATTDTHRLYAAARDAIERLPLYSTADGRLVTPERVQADSLGTTRTLTTWKPLGPGNIGGRTRVLVIDPAEPRVLYAAAVSGGVWKSTDAGAHWTATGDLMANLAVNSLVMDPRDRFTLYAGTGEGYYREDVRGTALPIRGDGIFVTHDGGSNWQQLAFTAGNSDFQWVNDLVISGHDSKRLYAGTRTGVWRSSDGGATWQRVLATTVKGGCTDLALRTDTPGDALFAACGVFEQASVYRTMNAESDGGWSVVLSEPGMSRTTLAIAPSNPSIVYALAASNNDDSHASDQNLLAVYRSDQNGDAATWTTRVRYDDPDALNRAILSNPLGVCGRTGWSAMGWHCNVIAVDPKNPERVWAAGVDLFRSDDGGRTWGIASYWWTSSTAAQFVHADQHAIVFDPAYDGDKNQTMYAANDGGVYRTGNANAAVGKGATSACSVVSSISWTSLNHAFGATQFYHGSVFPDGQTFAGGAQDNGTLVGTTASGIDGWTHPWGGDGAYVVVDPVDPRIVLTESQYAALARSFDGGRSFGSSANLPNRGSENYFLFVAPVAIDPNQHTRVWVGGAQMWRSENSAGTFVAASSPMPAFVSAIAVAPGNSNRVVAGTRSGQIVATSSAVTASATTSWTQTLPRTGYVSSVAFHPSNPNIVYATYAGFGGTHVWRSIDAGASWQAWDGSGDGALPDIPVHSLAIDPTNTDRIYLGTDLGVLVTLDGGAHWMAEASGFARVITDWVTIGQGAYGPAIYAFTHGRGVWRAELTAPAPRRRIAR